MALIPCLLFLSLLSHSIPLAKCDQFISGIDGLREEYDLLVKINKYRTTLNLTVLNVTKGADCLAYGIADSYKNKTCTTNTTSPNTTTLSSFPSYLTLLTNCGLNTTNTTVNGQILPACVPDQDPNLVFSNFASKYPTYLNSTNFSEIGIGSEDEWIVVVLTNITNMTNMTSGVSNGDSVLTTIGPVMFSLICLFMLV